MSIYFTNPVISVFPIDTYNIPNFKFANFNLCRNFDPIKPPPLWESIRTALRYLSWTSVLLCVFLFRSLSHDFVCSYLYLLIFAPCNYCEFGNKEYQVSELRKIVRNSFTSHYNFLHFVIVKKI